MRNITLLGSTGSIGQNTLDVIARNADRYSVFAVSANSNLDLLWRQCQQFNPLYAVVVQPEAADQFANQLKNKNLRTKVLVGQQGLIEIAQHPQTDCVLAAIVGSAGLLPTLAAAKAGKRILLANKEALVMSGALFMQAVEQNNATLLPIDSEHNAIFQCLPTNYQAGNTPKGIRRIVLTASGGPFRNLSLDQLAEVTPEQAWAHPNWVMGKKVSIDSATMMNKALEVVEAHWFFNVAPQAISVLLHPQSVVHSMVEYQDGSVLAQLGNPDMRTPIAHALAWPERVDSGVDSLDLTAIQNLQFGTLCTNRFPAIKLAYEVLEKGGTAGAILNAANEVSVDAFIRKQITFTDIVEINQRVLQNMPVQPASDLETIFAADAMARSEAQRLVNEKNNVSL